MARIARLWVGSSLRDLRGFPQEVRRSVPHAFQKKSAKGIAAPKKHMDLVRHRLAEAERLHKERQN